MKRIILTTLTCALACGVALAGDVDVSVTSGSVTVSDPTLSGITRVGLDWGSDSGGNVVASVTGVYGTVRRVTFAPDSATSAPTNLYDATLTDVDGWDVLRSLGSNLSNTEVTSRVPLTGNKATTASAVVVHGDLTLTISNAGNDKGGVVRLYLE